MAQRSRIGIAAGLAVVVTACGGSGSGAPTSSPPSGSPSIKAVSVVALGDSDATGIGDASGRGWVGRYGALLKSKLGVPVTVDNEAAEGKASDQLRTELSDDQSLRQALAKADVILIGIGGADLNAGDDALAAGSCKARACYGKILQSFDANIVAIANSVRSIAPDALLRGMSLPNAFPGAGKAIPSFITADISRYEVTAERRSVCHALASNGGRCVDVVRAFNGPNASADAYATGLMTKDPCCYPSAKGQQLIARLLIATGPPSAV
jgi:lysophospholipase L1-like esterase